MQPVRNDPSGAALLDIAHRTLMEELAPNLTGRDRYLALMIGNAVRIVARELEGADRHRATTDLAIPDEAGGLVAAIRSGDLDADLEMYAALRQATIMEVGISKPGMLLPTEREALASAGGDGRAPTGSAPRGRTQTCSNNP